MAPAVSLSTSAVPRRSHRARRRKYSDRSWVVAGVDHYSTDRIVDFVWQACDGSRTLAEIATCLSSTLRLPLDEAVASTAVVCEYFRGEGLLDYVAPAAVPGERRR
jgi:hypothetical protein